MTIEYNPYANTNKDFVAISVKDTSTSYPPSSKLFCNLCSCNLILLDAQKAEWFCNRCDVSYFPNKGQKVKRPSKFETPGPQTDKHGNIMGERGPIVSIVDHDANLKPKKSVFPRSLESLKRTGVHITGFNSTVESEGL